MTNVLERGRVRGAILMTLITGADEADSSWAVTGFGAE